jgi:hypothetical protein
VKPLLVGEANPYGSDPEFALYPSPPGCAGERLCRKVMGLTEREYLERFDRVNLCPTAWSMRRARARAIEILAADGGTERAYVLLGSKVKAAFGVGNDPFSHFRSLRVLPGPQVFVVLPHPSGLSRAWSAPGAYDRARAVLRDAGVL